MSPLNSPTSSLFLHLLSMFKGPYPLLSNESKNMLSQFNIAQRCLYALYKVFCHDTILPSSHMHGWKILVVWFVGGIPRVRSSFCRLFWKVHGRFFVQRLPSSNRNDETWSEPRTGLIVTLHYVLRLVFWKSYLSSSDVALAVFFLFEACVSFLLLGSDPDSHAPTVSSTLNLVRKRRGWWRRTSIQFFFGQKLALRRTALSSTTTFKKW
jgi:hypothetical protein